MIVPLITLSEMPHIKEMATPQTDSIAADPKSTKEDFAKACRSWEQQANHAWMERNDERKKARLYAAALGIIACGSNKENRMTAQKALNGEWNGDEKPVIRWEYADVAPTQS